MKEIISLVQTVFVFSSDIGMDFGTEKCALMIMKRRKLIRSEGIKLPDGRRIRSTGEDDDGYKYLGVLEVDDIIHEVMKTNMKKYTRRAKKAFTSKLKGGNVIKAINSLVVEML